MINTQKIYDLLCEALASSNIKNLVRGSMEGLPPMTDFQAMADGEKFAVVIITNVVPEYTGGAWWNPEYNYGIIITQKGVTGDITKTRDSLCNIAGRINEYFHKKSPIKHTIKNIIPQNTEAEKAYDGISVQIEGIIQYPDKISGPIND